MKQLRAGRRRGAVPAVAGLVLGLTLSACSGGGGGGESSTPVDGGVVTIGLEAEVNNFLPGTAQLGMPGRTMASAIYDPLVAVDPDGNFHPVLAESLEHNADVTEWTLKLRPGVKFHDGTPLDAQTLKTIFDDYLMAPGALTLGYLTDDGQPVKMQVVDELTVKYVLPETNASFPYVLSLDPGWPFSVKAAKAAGEDAGLEPVGTGPYKFESWTQDDKLVLTRNEDYWREGATHVDELIFRPIPDETSRLNSFQAGDIDMMVTARPNIITQLREMADTGDAQLEEYVGDNTGGNVMNTSRPPFDDVRVRKALIMATNTTTALEVLGGTGVNPETTQYFSEDSPWYSAEAAEIFPEYDPEGAKTLLEEYINDPDRSDGQPLGSPVSFEYQCQPTAELAELAQGYQSDWGKAGFEVTLKQIEQAAMIGNVVGAPDSKPAWAGNYQVACWRFEAEPDPGKLATDFGPVDSVLNFTNYGSPELTEAIADFRATPDRAKRKDAANRIAVILATDVPQQYLDGTVQAVAAAPGVHFEPAIELPDGATGRPHIEGAAINWSGVWREE